MVSSRAPWAHTPSNLTIIWLFMSLPLVTWDAGYVMLRPMSMPGGSLHWPIWAPYELYGKIDYIYGWKAYNEKNGFTAAQTLLNIVETAMYVYYLYILYAFGRPSTAQGRGAPKRSSVGFLGEQRSVAGPKGAAAVLLAFSAAVMTFSKTVLYCKTEVQRVLILLGFFISLDHGNETGRILARIELNAELKLEVCQESTINSHFLDIRSNAIIGSL
ncbi:hypothetical protein MBM_08359 [Drepanopeziza brunnea f. sp. 'multigermtubi' MB_m1]|uniref:Uncharacterized protein n=1 Tax=Marssonina brunnea f. sp. multigermtubi (strain MB_m1) TaxID=1072389 RepID=K1WLF0_MARBU|nr:uncharacterized protein MBM_08359 [Drepanopeziza brunnea f. sp. 'multigermtubi' MB_m1]EKD13641.1 hypothetical protein MBM_08359 [Drepanopeziza brunnea f. sp. 'multigermtubi' MB_m1]